MYYPLNYDKINLYQGTFTPSDKYSDSLAFTFWCRALYQRALSVFDFENLPADFNRQEIALLYYLVYSNGFCGAFPTEKYGNIVNPITLKGLNVFYASESFIVANPYLEEVDKNNHEYAIFNDKELFEVIEMTTNNIIRRFEELKLTKGNKR